MNEDELIQRVWDKLEHLHDQLVSVEAEKMTIEQLQFVDSSLSAILGETSRWFTVQSAP